MLKYILISIWIDTIDFLNQLYVIILESDFRIIMYIG